MLKFEKKGVLTIIGITIGVFILQIIFGNGFTNMFILKGDILQRPWILVTHIFLHGSFNHILFNMYGLLLFGGLLQSRIGWKNFLKVYFISGITAGIVGSFIYNGALGASAAVMGVVGALIILMPQLQLLFLFFIPMPLWIAGIMWFLINVFGILTPNSTANVAHIVGMGIGILMGFWFKKNGIKIKKQEPKTNKGQYLDNEAIDEYFRTGRI